MHLLDPDCAVILPTEAPAAFDRLVTRMKAHPPSDFDALRTARIRVATMDLRIAANARSRDLTVLTRNRGDFQKVPGLKIEDWIAT